jgi:hypothetical protein
MQIRHPASSTLPAPQPSAEKQRARSSLKIRNEFNSNDVSFGTECRHGVAIQEVANMSDGDYPSSVSTPLLVKVKSPIFDHFSKITQISFEMEKDFAEVRSASNARSSAANCLTNNHVTWMNWTTITQY